jgi:hypothetical protein
MSRPVERISTCRRSPPVVRASSAACATAVVLAVARTMSEGVKNATRRQWSANAPRTRSRRECHQSQKQCTAAKAKSPTSIVLKAT